VNRQRWPLLNGRAGELPRFNSSRLSQYPLPLTFLLLRGRLIALSHYLIMYIDWFLVFNLSVALISNLDTLFLLHLQLGQSSGGDCAQSNSVSAVWLLLRTGFF
jgi:hypothetical protein